LAPVLADAQVDLNPLQVDAALFAFQSPFSKGAILADEVGLGRRSRPACCSRSGGPSAVGGPWSSSRPLDDRPRQGMELAQDEKFRLFDGVLGASDEVLGAVESGVEFEKRIAAIYQQCRTAEQVQLEFDPLQRELADEIAAGQQDAREKLLDNFDQEVADKVRIQSLDVLDHFNERLWRVTRHVLRGHARFDDSQQSFLLLDNLATVLTGRWTRRRTPRRAPRRLSSGRA
jgi:hypothetical protein